MLGVDSTGIGDVVLGCRLSISRSKRHAHALTGFWIKSEALSNLSNSLRSEGAFGVCKIKSDQVLRHSVEHTNICHLPFSTAHVLW
jgi:hypothetical protein